MKTTKVYKNIEVSTESEKAQRVVSRISEASKGGKFFSVTFTKKDGSLREMNCRLGVEKHLKGGTKTLTDNYICVYDVKASGYRAINPETVLSINGKTINS